MDATAVLGTVRDENNTELSRLGSSKSLYADTEGEMDPETVLAVMADAAHHAAETFDGWASDRDVEGTFAAAAERERDHYDAIVGELDAHEPGDRPAAVEALRGLADSTARLGALLGWTLVAERKASQATGFFTGQAKPGTASTFRAFDEDHEAARADALAALEAVCDTEDDRASAEAAATAVVQAAYDAYVETLEGLGVNPKPVC